MGRKAKPLLLHVLEDTYRAGSHGHLLGRESVPADCPVDVPNEDARAKWDEIRAAFEMYQRVQQPKVKRRVAGEFGSAVTAFHLALEGGNLSVRERLYAAVGPSGRDIVAMYPGDVSAHRRAWNDWNAWDGEYGYIWRIQNSCETPSDKYRHVTEPVSDEPVPDPPGFAEFRASEAAP